MLCRRWLYRLSITVLAAHLVAFLGCRSGKGNEGTIRFGDPYKGLQCTLEPLKKEYRTGEQVIFRLKLTNVGNTAIYLPDRSWNRDANTGHIYVGDPDSAVDLKSGVLFPLIGWEKLEPGQELTCLTSGLWWTRATSEKKFLAEVKVAPPDQYYRGWAGLIYSSEVSIDIIGSDVDGPEESSSLSWDDPDTCAYLHVHGSPTP